MPIDRKILQFCVLSSLLLGVGIIIGSCGTLPKESADAQAQQPDITPVDVAIARSSKLAAEIEYTGTTEAVRTVLIRSQVEGQLLGLNVDVGDTVQRGQILVQVDDTLLVTEINQAEAELASLRAEVASASNQVSNARAAVEQARLELQQAQADSQRQQALFKQGAIAAQQAEQARTNAQTSAQVLRSAQEQVATEQQTVTAAQGRVTAQQAVVAQFQERRSYTRLTSPITGLVLERLREPGDLIQPGDEVLQLGDFSRVQVSVEVSELEIAKIQVGQSVNVRLDAFPNQNISGQVKRISPAADATSRLVPVEVVIPNSNGRIGSGLLARVSFASTAEPQVIVPQSAVLQTAAAAVPENTGTVFVLTVKEQTPAKVTARSVKLGEKIDGKVEILSGLKPGERFVTRSGKPLKNGETVRLSILSETTESKDQP